MAQRGLDAEPVQCRTEDSIVIEPVDQDLVSRRLRGVDAVDDALV